MDVCTIQQTPKYQRMTKCANTEDINLLEFETEFYLSKYGRIPQIDEISFLDSTNLFKVEVNEKKSSSGTTYTDIQNILDYTGANTLEEAIVILNNKLHPDLDIDIVPLGKQALLKYSKKIVNQQIIAIKKSPIKNDPIKNRIILTNMLGDLSRKLGIKFKAITNKELASEQWNGLVSDAKGVNAFIYNGDIYINVDNAKIDAPIHELSHILIGNIRYVDTELYSSLIQLIEKIPNINLLAKQYLNRTQNDILEEIFVSEFSKYLTGQQSIFSKLDPKFTHEIEYYMRRCLDAMLSGKYSINSIPILRVLKSNLLDLGYTLESSKIANSRTSSVDLSAIHRMVNNKKSELLKQGDIIQECS